MIRIDDYQKNAVIVIADDLTGAHEIGMILVGCKKRSFVLIKEPGDAEIESLLNHYDALVIDLDSRHLDGKRAYERVKAVLDCSEKIRSGLMYKKIDSTVRGNLAEEIDAILDEKLADIVFFVPALPEMKRITVGGYHLVNHIPVGKTEYSEGIESSKVSYLPTLIREKSRYEVDRIPLQVVESGYEETIKYSRACYEKGARILVGDACTNEDLRVIRDAIVRIDLKILPVGSTGLFRQFFPPHSFRDAYPCLVVCGSLNKVSRAQVKKLRAHHQVKTVELSLMQIFKNKAHELKRTVKTVCSILEEGSNVILSTPQNNYQPNLLNKPMNENYFATEIEQFLASVVRKTIDIQKVSGLVLTGGDISVSIIRALEATGIEVKRQLANLVPVGILRGGPFDGLSVITKTGGFGEEQILINAVEYLRNRTLYEG